MSPARFCISLLSFCVSWTNQYVVFHNNPNKALYTALRPALQATTAAKAPVTRLDFPPGLVYGKITKVTNARVSGRTWSLDALGNFLQHWRQQRRLSLREAARLTGGRVSHATIRNLERGERQGRSGQTMLSTLQAIAGGYNIPLETLLEMAGIGAEGSSTDYATAAAGAWFAHSPIPPGSAELPEGVRHAVLRHLHNLSPGAARNLQMTGVAGRARHVLRYLLMSGVDTTELARALDVDSADIEDLTLDGDWTPHNLYALARITGIRPDWLTTGRAQPTLDPLQTMSEIRDWVQAIEQARQAKLDPDEVMTFVNLVKKRRLS